MLHSVVRKLYHEYDEEWDGYFYRCGKPGSFAYYHTNVDGAEFYKDSGEVKRYVVPDYKSVLVIDVDCMEPTKDYVGLEFVADMLNTTADDLDDWVTGIEEILPRLANKYEAVIINGETGAEVTGTPIEVVDLGVGPD